MATMTTTAVMGAAAAAYGAWNYYTQSPAVGDDEWIPMPDGKLYHISCIHHHDDDFKVQKLFTGSLLTKKNSEGHVEQNWLPPCQYKPKMQEKDENLGYYSDWSVYAQMAETVKNFSEMSSVWTVPPAPKHWGPAGLSSVYIFNGLEDGGGIHGKSSLILQPVLQYGKSGCLNDPLLWHEWHLTSYLVDGNGRAHCGSRIKVNEGEQVYGGMIQTDKASNTWEVVSKTMGRKKDSTSKYSASLGDVKINAAYATLEGMIIYDCHAWPTNDGVNFEQNKLVLGDGTTVNPKWTPEIRHTECGQAVTSDANGDVKLHYNPDM